MNVETISPQSLVVLHRRFGHSSFREIVAAGHDAETVRKVLALVDRNEFKRRQAVMGARVTAKAFGKDRRLPVTNRFRP